jgi:hypothetical protein
MRVIVFLSQLVLLAACSGPTLWLPGGKLRGPESPLDPAAVPQGAGVIQLETNPDDPYSVNIGYQLIEGRIYIDPAPERRWFEYIQADPDVRIRFDGSEVVHPAVAERVTDADVLARFDPQRIVLRLKPRDAGHRR